MNVKILDKKPIVNLLPVLYFPNPGRNYLNSVMHHFYAATGARCVLDAGAGLLRNFELFREDYSGIGLDRKELWQGLDINKPLIGDNNSPKLYEWNMDEAFDFLGPFDFCFCTATLGYLTNKLFSLECMIETLRQDGFLLYSLADKDEAVDLAHKISHRFRDVYVFYFTNKKFSEEIAATRARLREDSDGEFLNFGTISADDVTRFLEKTREEMYSSAAYEDNTRCAVVGWKKTEPFVEKPTGPELELINGVYCKVSRPA